MISQLSLLCREMTSRMASSRLDRPRALLILVVIAAAIGAVARISPVLDLEARVFWQYMSEDGYLMQTVARNMALGLGMSTAEGTIQTNGVQPLATYIYATLHALVDGARASSIMLVTLISAAAAIGAAICLFRLAKIMLSGLAGSGQLALGIAVLWFAAPQIIPHSMNGLETGIYWLVALATVWLYAHLVEVRRDQFRWGDRVVLGLMLGLTFLARNDAVFLIAGLLASHLFVAGNPQGSTVKERFVDCLVAGIVSILVAAPWLLNNLVKFGSIVPISGTAQSHSAGFGHNIAMVPANIFEQLALYLPIPRHLETHWAIAVLSLASVAVVLGIFWCSVGRCFLVKRRVCIAVGLFGSALSLYYGLFFGAPHFLSRYLSVLSPFLWLATVTVVWALVLMMFRDPRHQKAVAFCFVSLGLLSGAIVAGKDFIDGKQHAHRQVVDWVDAHVPEATWVGAVQTGTLGYFHDRTINLDGKVNPAALQRIRQDGDVRGYVLESEIQYLVDWEDLSRWVSYGASQAFRQQFELVVHDVPRNLAVIRRVGAPALIPIDSSSRESFERAN